MIKNRNIFAPSIKIWLQKDSLNVMGSGGALLLKSIKVYGSIAEAAKRTGFSYRYAWNKISEIEKALGQRILETKIGGKDGGGAKLTQAAIKLLQDYDRIENYVKGVLEDNENWEDISLKLSARNRIKGIVENVEKDSVTSKIKIRTLMPVTLTAVITKEAVEDLDVKPGDEVEAVIKSTEVMIAKE